MCISYCGQLRAANVSQFFNFAFSPYQFSSSQKYAPGHNILASRVFFFFFSFNTLRNSEIKKNNAAPDLYSFFFFLMIHAVNTSEFGLDIEDYLVGE